jgi:hypothetical protein
VDVPDRLPGFCGPLRWTQPIYWVVAGIPWLQDAIHERVNPCIMGPNSLCDEVPSRNIVRSQGSILAIALAIYRKLLIQRERWLPGRSHGWYCEEPLRGSRGADLSLDLKSVDQIVYTKICLAPSLNTLCKHTFTTSTIRYHLTLKTLLWIHLHRDDELTPLSRGYTPILPPLIQPK